MSAEIKSKLKELYLNDQRVRITNNSDLQKSLDKTNFQIIKNLVTEFGYISTEKYGKLACKRAWVLIQHGRKEDIDFMKQYLTLIKNNLNDYNKSHYDYLLDKICFLENKPQVFGTQFLLDSSNKLSFDPIEDKEGLDSRRLSYKLEPFEKYAEYVKSRLEI